ncbi:MAG: ClpXP protease specificity-enhancing factor [Burkholderiales bacterium]|nr:ClpXP protease specificity-enhancing factor [Burkholderiales bacterium]
MKEVSTTPYLIRGIWEWCVDCGFTPYVAVKVDSATRVPMEYVRNGEIVLNVSPDATRSLKIGNDLIQFSARFNGVSHEVSVPISSVAGIFAKENGQGLVFQPGPGSNAPALVPPSGDDPGDGDKPKPPGNGDKPKPPGNGRPKLQVVK